MDINQVSITVDKIRLEASRRGWPLSHLVELMYLTGCRMSDLRTKDNLILGSYPVSHIQPAKNNNLRTFTDPAIYKRIDFLINSPMDYTTFQPSSKIRHICMKYLKKLDLKVRNLNVNTYIFRYAYVARLKNEGKTIEQIKDMMGHKNTLSTLEYFNNI